MFRRGFCCCKRKNYKPRTHFNEEFPINRRYAFVLKTLFICFTYGFAIPMLFLVAFLVLMVQYFLDKLLITYYYKERIEHNDMLNRIALSITKYGISIFLCFGGFAIAMNNCATINTREPLVVVTSNPKCRHDLSWQPKVMFYSGLASFIIMVLFDLS
jgi:hypothetical protein